MTGTATTVPYQEHHSRTLCVLPDVLFLPQPSPRPHLWCREGSGRGICPPGLGICHRGGRVGFGTRPPGFHSACRCSPGHRRTRNWRCHPHSAHGGMGLASSHPRCAHTPCPRSLRGQTVRLRPLAKVLPTAVASAQFWLSSTSGPAHRANRRRAQFRPCP